jgi:ketosteroid isomerase-like protein
MPQENLDVAREAITAWNAGDMDRLCELYDPNAVMHYHNPNWPEVGPWVGRESIMRQFRWLRDTWDRDSLQIVGDLLAADDRVVVHATWRVAGHGPGGDMETAWVYTMRTGLIIRADFFRDYAEAREAAGLGVGPGTTA